MGVGKNGPYGFEATFNPSLPSDTGDPCGWVSPRHFGLNNRPMVAMVENYRAGLIWKLIHKFRGMGRAGFSRRLAP